MEFSRFWDRLCEGWQINVSASLVLVCLFGNHIDFFRSLAILVAFDWLTKWAVLSRQVGGFWAAWRTDVISSQGMRGGLKKIVWYGTALIVGHQLSYISIAGYSPGGVSTEIICTYLMVIEAKSILENLRDMGFKEAGPLVAMLGRKRDQITGEHSQIILKGNEPNDRRTTSL